MIDLTEQELNELKSKYNNVQYNELLGFDYKTEKLSTGKIVKGYVTENNIFMVKSASELLLG